MIDLPRTHPTARRGTTLLELTATLVLVGVLLSVALSPLRSIADRARAVAAREEVLALVHRGRVDARRLGGAILSLDAAEDRATLQSTDGDTLSRLDLGASGVDLQLGGSTRVAELHWNALGWGVVASRSVRLTRGSAVATLVISSRGRASRR